MTPKRKAPPRIFGRFFIFFSGNIMLLYRVDNFNIILYYYLVSFYCLLVLIKGQQCVDRPHFNYNCWQLSMYCDRPQADGIRNSCPVTCGTCGRSSARSENVDDRPRESNLGQIERQPAIPPSQTFVTDSRYIDQGRPPSSSPRYDDRNPQVLQESRNLQPPVAFKGSIQPVRSEEIIFKIIILLNKTVNVNCLQVNLFLGIISGMLLIRKRKQKSAPVAVGKELDPIVYHFALTS